MEALDLEFLSIVLKIWHVMDKFLL